MQIGSNTYKLILLDTNAIREIVTNTKCSGKGFLEKFLTKEKDKYAPCFSIYNVIELMPYQDIYEKFLEFFSIIPCIMIFPNKNIFQKEVECCLKEKKFIIDNQIANIFTPYISKDNYNCKSFFHKLSKQSVLMNDISLEIRQFSDIAKDWEDRRKNTEIMLKAQHLPLNMIDEKFYMFYEKVTIVKDLMNFDIIVPEDIDISKLPASRIMEYSQFTRIYKTRKNLKANDVMDIQISCIIPYVDAVITENFQADVYRKAKRLIPQIKELEVYTLKDIRLS